jgi:hypothetical protein
LVRNDLEDAQYHLERALELRTSLGNYQGLEVTYKNLAWVAYRQHDLTRACALYVEFAAMSNRIGNESMLREAIYKLGSLAMISGNPKVALQLLGASGLSQGNGHLNVDLDQPAFQAAYEVAQDAFGYAVLNEAFTAGINMSLEEAVAISARDICK